MTAAGVVAAMAAEARALGSRRGDGSRIVVSGIGCEAAERAAALLVEQGASALVSWGMAGGLDPSLAAGMVCLPSTIVGLDGSALTTAGAWREELGRSIGACRRVAGGELLTSSRALETPAAKQDAHRRTGAAAVDMESLAIARVAAAHGLPFVAVRVIVDTAGDAVPRAVAAASEAGEVRIPRLIAELIRAPGDLASILRLARRYRAALGSLAAIARVARLAPPAGVAPPPSSSVAAAPSRT